MTEQSLKPGSGGRTTVTEKMEGHVERPDVVLGVGNVVRTTTDPPTLDGWPTPAGANTGAHTHHWPAGTPGAIRAMDSEEFLLDVIAQTKISWRKHIVTIEDSIRVPRKAVTYDPVWSSFDHKCHDFVRMGGFATLIGGIILLLAGLAPSLPALFFGAIFVAAGWATLNWTHGGWSLSQLSPGKKLLAYSVAAVGVSAACLSVVGLIAGLMLMRGVNTSAKKFGT